MWECEKCKAKFEDALIATDVRYGYIDSEKAQKRGNQYNAFQTEQGWGPLCAECAIVYIKNG